MNERSALDEAIAGLEALRGRLGGMAVDAAIDALRRHALPGAGSGPRLRQVSVLFADVADSTAMLGRVGAEDVADLLGRALQDFAAAVRRWDGEVLRFTGDGIKAAFGTRGLREDEAERAVRAGLQILADAEAHAERVRRELGIEDFGVRVGIHTGPVLLGQGVEAESSAMGQAVHLAARMEQSAPVGRLRVSDATWTQVRGLFRAAAQPPLVVKGVATPLQTWLVEGAESGPEPRVERGVDGVAPPMIGRGAELAQLLAVQRRAVDERRLHSLLVLGEAGVGKTRLRLELLAALGLHEGDAGLLQARAHPSTPLQPHGLLRQLLARWLGIPDDFSAAAARERLVTGLAPWLGAAAATQAPRIGHLIGLDFAGHPSVQALGPAALRREAFAALHAALLARARHTPLLLVLDDLHWADEASLAFVQQLLVPAAVPLFVLLLARPALRERAVAVEAATALELAPLAEAAGRALVEALLQPLPDPPPALCRLLLERADGNPFFLEALVRMLIDDGVIDAAARPWRLHAERLAALRVPPTLVGVLQARLDALPAAERTALQGASIVGPVFWDAALAAVDSGAPQALPMLMQRALVRARGASAFAHTAEHAFAHQLLHDTTYATVLKAARREGHARVARWLAERMGERAAEFLAITAQHFEQAGDSAQALEYWDLAHQGAFMRCANTEALHFLERALAQPALVDTRWRFMLLTHRLELLQRQSRVDEAERALEAMATWAETCDDDAMRADVSVARMLQADHAGRPEDAARLAAQALAEVQRAACPEAASAGALAHGERAWLALQRHDFDATAAEVAAGLVHARVAGGVARRHGGYAGYENQLRAIAIDALTEQERYVDALAAVQEGRAALSDGNSLQDRFNLLLRESTAQRELGLLADARVSAEEALATARTTGDARLQISALLALSQALLAGGGFDRAATLLAETAALIDASGIDYEWPQVHEQQGHVARAHGDAAAARQAWQQAREGYAAQERSGGALRAGAQLALLDLAAGDAAAARAAVESVVAAADERAHRKALSPDALLACQQVLAALHDARAAALRADLLARLDAQLGALADGAARERLLRAVPHWRAVHALR